MQTRCAPAVVGFVDVEVSSVPVLLACFEQAQARVGGVCRPAAGLPRQQTRFLGCSLQSHCAAEPSCRACPAGQLQGMLPLEEIKRRVSQFTSTGLPLVVTQARAGNCCILL